MPTATEPYAIEQDGWTVRVQPPAEPETAGVILLLHGWTGDERVMWVFTRALAGRFWLFAPRAPLPAVPGGYGWIPHGGQGWPALEDFEQVTGSLLSAFDGWAEYIRLPAAARERPLHLMGFSQGAAMSFATAAYHPQRTGCVAALAGFLPRRANSEGGWEPAFRGRSVYVAHGSRDEIVPVRMAYETVREMQAAGADVTFCESDVGHKLSADCLKGLESFFHE